MNDDVDDKSVVHKSVSAQAAPNNAQHLTLSKSTSSELNGKEELLYAENDLMDEEFVYSNDDVKTASNRLAEHTILTEDYDYKLQDILGHEPNFHKLENSKANARRLLKHTILA